MTKPAQTAPPPVAPETWRALLAATAEFTALEPWEFAADSECVGLIDPVTGEKRIGHVMGNGGEIFAAAFYRRTGIRWLLNMFSEEPALDDFNLAEGMDCLKVEFVPKHELWNEDLAMIKNAGFKSTLRPAGKAVYWPQFRSSEPGWHPWFINQAEAEQMLADLPRLAAFLKLLEQSPEIFDNRNLLEIPFLPVQMPDRPLTPSDLDWQPIILPPLTGLEPFRATVEQRERLHTLTQMPGLECEFDCALLPGASFSDNGRPCFGRIGILVERPSGIVTGTELTSGALPPGAAAGQTLVKGLLMGKVLPAKIFIGGSRLLPVLQPLCDELKIELCPVSSLPLLDEAVFSLSQHMQKTG